jgi:DMSO/TMAO reductase YedYZ heme-binding membrane subunit
MSLEIALWLGIVFSLILLGPLACASYKYDKKQLKKQWEIRKTKITRSDT